MLRRAQSAMSKSRLRSEKYWQAHTPFLKILGTLTVFISQYSFKQADTEFWGPASRQNAKMRQNPGGYTGGG
jgi:hypothetical protein